MSESSEEKFNLQELNFLLLEILQDREEIRKLNEKHFNAMLSLYNDSKKLYEDTLKIQQELIERFGTDKINEKKSLASPNEIIITGIPENVNDKPIIIAEKVFESIGIEVPKTAIISSRKVIKKSKTRNISYSTSTDKILCNNNKPNTNSIIVSLSNPALTSKIIHRKCTHRNLKSSTVFSSAHATSEININKVYPASVYKLFIETRNASRLAGLSMPKIKENIILIKTDDNHPPISIKTREDLDKFKNSATILS